MSAKRSLQLTDLDELVPHPENPKDHAVALLGASIDEFGLVEPIVLDERTGFIISGHGRRKLLLERRQSKPGEIPDGVTVADGRWQVDVVRGWASRDDGHARTALVTLNSVGPKGGWLASLADVLELIDGDGLLAVTGFSDAELQKLVIRRNPPPRDLLAEFDVTMGAPEHKVEPGDCYRLAGRHHLVVGEVMTGWASWAPLLVGDAMFVPYPGPYAALTELAESRTLVLVQPEPYIAGHLLDKYAAVAGDESIVKVA